MPVYQPQLLDLLNEPQRLWLDVKRVPFTEWRKRELTQMDADPGTSTLT